MELYVELPWKDPKIKQTIGSGRQNGTVDEPFVSNRFRDEAEIWDCQVQSLIEVSSPRNDVGFRPERAIEEGSLLPREYVGVSAHVCEVSGQSN